MEHSEPTVVSHSEDRYPPKKRRYEVLCAGVADSNCSSSCTTLLRSIFLHIVAEPSLVVILTEIFSALSVGAFVEVENVYSVPTGCGPGRWD